jgi:hypothetical protein
MDIQGTWTLEKITYAVKNNLEAGLKTTAGYNFSLDQLEAQVISERNALIKQMEMQGVVDYSDLLQEINCIELDCKDLGLCCETSTKQPTLHFILPAFNHLDYIGLATQDTPFKVYDNIGFKYNKYRDSRLTNRPYIQFRNKDGVIHGFVFNAPTHNLKYLSARLVLENPLEVNRYDCCTLNPREDRFPIPDYMVQQIIDGITSKWASWYYRFQGQRFPNTQNSIG